MILSPGLRGGIMRIEINSQKGGIATISGFQTDYTALLNETDSVIDALNRMKSYSYSMNGGLGVLQNAVGDIDSRIQAEESKRTALQTAQQKCNNFFTLVSQTDNSCAGMVSQNQEEFYQVNQWSAPSALASMMDSWYQSAKSWLKKALGVIEENVDHAFKVYTETDFSSMSPEELNEYYERITRILESGEADADDIIRAKALLNYLGGKYSTDNERIEKFVNLFETIYPDQRDRVEAARQLYENGQGSQVTNDSKYQIYSEFLDSGIVSDEFIKHQFEAASTYPAALYHRICFAQDEEKYIGVSSSANEMAEKFAKGTNRGYKQGTTWIYDAETHRNSDGSVDISFKCANSTKRYTEITVYDKDGTIISREYLEGQKDPSSISGVFGEGGKMIKDLVTGKVLSADCESFNSKAEYNLHIPAGGYIQITEDPSQMDQGAYSQERINELSTKTIDATLDTVEVDTGNPVVDIGVDVVKGLMTKNASDQMTGTQSSFEDYGKDAVSTVTDSTIEAVANAGEGNPAGIGLAGIKVILKGNSMAEPLVRNAQQKKSIGNGSLYIYN